MSRRNNNQNNQYNNQYYGNGNGQQYYNGNNQYNNQNGQYYNQNGQYYNQNGQYYNQNQNRQYYNQNQQFNQQNQPQNQQQNQQNKYGLYNQQQNNNEKKKKFSLNNPLFVKIGAGIAIILLIAGVLFLINRCSNKGDDSGVSYSDENKIVGNDTLGYVTVPGDWVKFKDVNEVRGIQYSDKDGNYIITLDALATSEISAKDYALGTASNLQQAGITDIQGAEVTLGKYNAYQIYGVHGTTNVWVLVYFFEAEDGNTHYVGVEGPDKGNEAFRIPDTFSLKK